MSRWGCSLKIINGRGNADRQVVTVQKNVDADSRDEAHAVITEYARGLGMGALLDDADARIVLSIHPGNGCWS